MKRRDVIVLAGGAGLSWPLAPRAQQTERARRVGVLLGLTADDPQFQDRVTAFQAALRHLGWMEGRNLRIDIRSHGGDSARARAQAAELVALAPDVIFAGGAASLAPLLHATRSLPIVFAQAVDPVGAGLVESLARPGGNATGFTQFDYGLSAKWLELLKEMVPRLTRVAVLRDAQLAAGIGQFAVVQSVAPALGVDVSPVGLQDVGDIERRVAAFARAAPGGLILTAAPLAAVHRERIIALAAQHKLPAIYPYPYVVPAGGLLAYGADLVDQWRAAAGYVDRILRGASPAELPVQAPTKYKLAINLKTAAALGLAVPPAILARADEVIE